MMEMSARGIAAAEGVEIVSWEVKRVEGFQLGDSDISRMKGRSQHRRAATNGKSNQGY